MKIYPAIDLLKGSCIRLEKGDFARKTTYSQDPTQVAQEYAAQGAKHIHIVDLDGARAGRMQQTATIAKIISTSGLAAQVGGGVRSAEDCQRLLDAGVGRIIIGSLAVKDPNLVKSLLKKFGPNRFTLALDFTIAENGAAVIATHGWQVSSGVDLGEVLQGYLPFGIDQVLATDISRDGMLQGPNFEIYQTLTTKYPSVKWLASGGVSQATDIERCQALNLGGVVIGKALYEGSFTLREVLPC